MTKKIITNLTAQRLIDRLEQYNDDTGLPYASIVILALAEYLPELRAEPVAVPKKRAPSKPAKPFVPPTMDELADCFREKHGLRNPTEQAKRWLEYYEARGWKWGTGAGRPIKRWRSVAATWARGKERGQKDEPVDFDNEPFDLGL
jgi:hypothetical protein